MSVAQRFPPKDDRKPFRAEPITPMNPHPASMRRHPLVRFLACVRPQLTLVIGAALMGVGKFTLPLAFPFAFKYVVDVLLVAQPKPDHIDRIVDSWCTAIARL